MIRGTKIHVIVPFSALPGGAVQHQSVTALSVNGELLKNTTAARDWEDAGYERGAENDGATDYYVTAEWVLFCERTLNNV